MGAVSNTLWDAAVMGLAVLSTWLVVRELRRHYRHHRCANKRFMAGYRAGFRAAHAIRQGNRNKGFE
jgi:hypothetical protein